MDPSETLKRLRELVTSVRKGCGSDRESEFAELVEALDKWLRMGGVLPLEWRYSDTERPSFMMDRATLSAFLQDSEQMFEQVTATQAANTKLVEENRVLKARLNATLAGMQRP